MNAEALRSLARHPLPWILLLATVLRAQAAGYARASDDLDYAAAARDVLEGTYRPGDGFHALRVGLILPTALSFALFGVRYGASVLWPVVSSVLSVAVLYGIVLRLSSRTAAAIAALLLSVSTQHVLSGAELFPDAPLTLWSLLAVWLYARAREGRGGAWRFGLAGLCFYGALATRIEALKILPVVAFLEVLYRRRKGPDRAALGFLGAAALGLAIDTLFLGLRTGHPAARLGELFPALESWDASPAARGPALAPMLKSLVSPFGAFGLLFLLAVPGAAWAVRESRLRAAVAIAGYLLATTLVLAVRFRLADGRFYTLLSPMVAWFAAELLVKISDPRRRWTAVAGAAFAGAVFLHARLPYSTMSAYSELAGRLPRDTPVHADGRTRGILRVYFDRPDVRDYAASPPTRPCWLVNNELMRSLDRALYGRDGFPDPAGPPVWSVRLAPTGLPGFRELGRGIQRLKGPVGEGPRLELYRLE